MIAERLKVVTLAGVNKSKMRTQNERVYRMLMSEDNSPRVTPELEIKLSDELHDPYVNQKGSTPLGLKTENLSTP